MRDPGRYIARFRSCDFVNLIISTLWNILQCKSSNKACCINNSINFRKLKKQSSIQLPFSIMTLTLQLIGQPNLNVTPFLYSFDGFVITVIQLQVSLVSYQGGICLLRARPPSHITTCGLHCGVGHARVLCAGFGARVCCASWLFYQHFNYKKGILYYNKHFGYSNFTKFYLGFRFFIDDRRFAFSGEKKYDSSVLSSFNLIVLILQMYVHLKTEVKSLILVLFSSPMWPKFAHVTMYGRRVIYKGSRSRLAVVIRLCSCTLCMLRSEVEQGVPVRPSV